LKEKPLNSSITTRKSLLFMTMTNASDAIAARKCAHTKQSISRSHG
jgi:hypothetical protein